MRWFAWPAVVALLSLLAACGGAEQEDYIDSTPSSGSVEALWGFPGDGSLPAILGALEAVVVAEVIEVVGVQYSGPYEVPESIPTAIAESWSRGLPYTTYRIGIDQWLKGSGGQEILITNSGGITPDGPIFFDGDFLLEPGRKYVMALVPKGGMPGDGVYTRRGGSRGTFEVTDDFVHVLNHPLADDLQAQYGGTALADFVQVLEGYVANPPPPPTPSPAPTPQPAPGAPSLVINTVAIDADISADRTNTATSLGSRIACNTVKTSAILTLDITIDSVPAVGEGGGGITGFLFTLGYDRSKVTVSALDHDMLLAANPGSQLIPLSDATPDTDGSLLVAAVDFGDPTAAESGSGVLARITLEGVGPGVSDLTLTGVTILDDSRQTYSVDNVLAAQVAVDAACPPL